VQPGLRYEHTDIHDTFWNQVTNPDDSAGASAFASNQTKYDFVLPSVHANYRPDAETVVRASIWRSYVRPAFFQLAGGRRTTLNPDGSIDITEGNPNLKAISAVNYDVSYEHAGATGTQFMVGLFLKDMSNYLYDRGNTYRAQAVAQTGISSISRPENGGDARVYGLEMSGRRQFMELPGWLGGLGVSGNLTLQRSKVDLKDPDTDSGMRMQGSPDLLYNASLFYDRDGVTASLSYRYGGPTLVSYRFGDYGGADLNEWQRATRTLDASVAYQFHSGLKLTLSASNLLNDYGYYRTVGRDSGTIPQLVSSGRNAFISAAYSF
jgi:TonB-dependent receptor